MVHKFPISSSNYMDLLHFINKQTNLVGLVNFYNKSLVTSIQQINIYYQPTNKAQMYHSNIQICLKINYNLVFLITCMCLNSKHNLL